MHSPGLDDSELLRRARVDANAFAVFYRRHARAVYRSLLSDCGDPDVALDLTAETFARALQSIGRFRGLRVTSGRAWIFAIAQLAAPAVRARAPHRGSGARRLGILEATRLAQRRRLGRRARRRRGVARRDSRTCMDELPESQQSVLRLRIEDEATYEEIAAPARLLARGGAPAGLARACAPERALPGGRRVSAARSAASRALERTLVGAAGRAGAAAADAAAPRVIVLRAVAAPLTLAAAASMARRGLSSAASTSNSRHCATTACSAAPARLRGSVGALGARPRDARAAARWLVAGQRVMGYTTPSGSFCLRFAGL